MVSLLKQIALVLYKNYQILLIVFILLIGIITVTQITTYAGKSARQWYKEFERVQLELVEERQYSSIVYKKLSKMDNCVADFDELPESVRRIQRVVAYCLTYEQQL